MIIQIVFTKTDKVKGEKFNKLFDDAATITKDYMLYSPFVFATSTK
jgi:GTP-binding protein EngB required for normal cell division